MMRMDELLSNDAVLGELGRRLERHRLQRNLTQAEMAEQAGIGRSTLQRLEHGHSVQTGSLTKLLAALDLLGALDAALPEALERPIAQLESERRGRRRRAGRVNRRAPEEAVRGPWRWGDEPQETA